MEELSKCQAFGCLELTNNVLDLKSFTILELLLMHQKWYNNKKLIWEYKMILGLLETLNIIMKQEKFLL